MIDATFHREELADALTWVSKAITKTPTIPVLAGIRLTFADAGVTIRGFNYDVSHTAHIGGTVIKTGEVLVPAATLREMVAALDGDDVTITHGKNDTAVTLTSRRAAFRLPILPIEDYPDLPSDPPTVGVISAAGLTRLAKGTWWATSRDLHTAALMGVKIVGDDGELMMAATNRFVLARVTAPWDLKGDRLDVLAPALELNNAIAGLAGQVELGYDGKASGLLRLSSTDRSVTLRLLDLEYANVDRFFDMCGDDLTATVDVAPMVAAVKRAKVVLDDNKAALLRFGDGHIAVSAGDDRAVDDEVDATVNGPETDAGFNPAFLIEALSVLNAPRARIAMHTDGGKHAVGKPVLFTPDTDDPAASDIDVIVMPRRVG